MTLSFKLNCKITEWLLLVLFFTFSKAGAQSSYDFLSSNNIKARINSGGLLFWDGKKSAYIVPKDKGVSSVSAAGVWIGGYDQKNFLHIAAQGYNDFGTDYFPGPLDTAGKTDSATSAFYNKVWKITRLQVDSFRQGLSIPDVIKTWPANGNTAKGYAQKLAPYVDADNDGIYDYTKGDYPDVKGDVMLWMVYNDNLNLHTETHGRSMKVEIQLSAYAFDCKESYMQNSVFLDYKIINRSKNIYDSVFTGVWADLDLGNPFNDYTGCDSVNNSFYIYDATSNDRDTIIKTLGFDTVQYKGYHKKHGVQSVSFMGGGMRLNGGLPAAMSRYIYYLNDSNNSAFPQSNPKYDQQYYFYLSGSWQNGKPLKDSGTGVFGNHEVHFAFSGNAVTKTGWTEPGANNTAGDRKTLGSFGPFQYKPNDEISFTAAFLFTTSDDGRSKYALQKMTDETKILQQLFTTGEMVACNSITDCSGADTCVYPGDLNNDKKADLYDAFRIGYAYGTKDSARQNRSATWQPLKAKNWASSFPDGTNYKHADANGDGIIDSADVLPVVYNYSNTHKKKDDITSTTTLTDVQLFVNILQDSLATGDEADVTVSLRNGGSGNKHSVFGIAYTLVFDSLVTEKTSPADITGCYLGKPSELVLMDKDETHKKQTHTTLVRRFRRGKFDTTGLVTRYKYVITDNISGGFKKNSVISIVDAKIIDSNLKEFTFSLVKDSVKIYQQTTTVREYNIANRLIKIFPNPFTNELIIDLNGVKASEVSITNLYGKEVYRKSSGIDSQLRIDACSFDNSFYLVRVITSTGGVINKKIVKF